MANLRMSAENHMKLPPYSINFFQPQAEFVQLELILQATKPRVQYLDIIKKAMSREIVFDDISEQYLGWAMLLYPRIGKKASEAAESATCTCAVNFY